jgi:acyl dehydratase
MKQPGFELLLKLGCPSHFLSPGRPKAKIPPRGAASRRRSAGAFFVAGPPQGKNSPSGGQQAEGAARGLFSLYNNMKFAEFEVGMLIKHPLVPVTREEMLDFAQKYDPQSFHIDDKQAEEGHWGGLIASGWLTCGKAMRMAVDSALHDSESFGSPGLERLRWVLPVRAGDSIRLEATVASKRVSSSRSDLGIIRWNWNVFNQRDELVLEMEATSMFELKSEQE